VNPDAILTIGSNATCDLQLDDPSVSGLHAQARLDPGRFLWVRDENSARGVHLGRNDGWVRARLVCLCVGDRLRFGEVEVELEALTSLFGPDVDVRLAPAPEGSLYDPRVGRYTLRDPDKEPTLSTPKRNPETGELESGPEGATSPDFDAPGKQSAGTSGKQDAGETPDDSGEAGADPAQERRP
jgi:pSer/pThr/pTyr-binding forkhead associated (FHA) protein